MPPHTSKTCLRVKRSAAGLGLFTDEPIDKGDFVIEYHGEVISREEADRRGGKYLFEISSRRTVDGSSRANIARYINHSCKPNCEVEVCRGKICIFAKRRIKKGEELTYDYGEEYFNAYIKPSGCKCAGCQEV